jgi:hypothetical protein
MTLRRVFESAAIFAAASGITFTFFLNFCNWVYRCGCQSLWAGAAEHCNMHHATGRHCPFCVHGTSAYYFVLAWILIPQFILSWCPIHWGWVFRLMAALLLFPVTGLLAAASFGWWDGYWA